MILPEPQILMIFFTTSRTEVTVFFSEPKFQEVEYFLDFLKVSEPKSNIHLTVQVHVAKVY